jgi:hypothetical protein
LFGDTDKVDNSEFVRKVSGLVCLPSQSIANAKETLSWFFDPENNEKVSFAQFCGFLAMFGPVPSAMRKLGHFLKCPPELRDALVYLDVAGIEENEEELGSEEGNLFTVEMNGKSVAIYNRIDVESSEQYLIDGEGKAYGSWVEVFEALASVTE